MELSSGTLCKGCGVKVPPGYPKCPRCKMPQSHAGAAPAASRPHTIQGGTSLSSETRPWRWIVAGALAIALVLVLVLRGGGEKKVGNLMDDDSIEAEDEDSVEDTSAALPVGATASDDEATDDELEIRSLRASKQLEVILAGDRLWSTVSIEDDIVVVESASCEVDASMRERLRAALDEVEAKTLGWGRVECRAKHGAVIFEERP